MGVPGLRPLLARKVEDDLAAGSVGLEMFVCSSDVFHGENAVDHRANRAALDKRQNMSGEPADGIRFFLDRTCPQYRADNGGALPQEQAEINFGFAAGC